MYVCVCVFSSCLKNGGGTQRASPCGALLRVDFPTAALAKASAGRGEPEKIRL